MPVQVKICGLTSEDAVDAVNLHGAHYAGFIFFPKSPRYVTPDHAGILAERLTPDVRSVAVMVDPDDALVDSVTAAYPYDFLQLHGLESPARVLELSARTGISVIKAVSVRCADDVAAAHTYKDAAHTLLFDAKAPKDAVLPGGNGLSFDWQLLKGRNFAMPWMLSGGLHAGNVEEAIRMTQAPQIDVSSGVESAPGVKSPQQIAELMDVVRGL